MLPGSARRWEEDLRLCHETHQFRGIRLHPGYHGYKLAEPSFARLLALAAGRGLLVQVVVAMEDERTQHPVLRAPAVDLRPLETLVGTVANLRLVILSAFRTLSVEGAERLAAAGKVYFDIATLEKVDRIATLVERVGADRVVFGSHFPLFYIESAALKLRETKLSAEVVTQIARGNAQQLLGP
jgi:uncharacterized protein